MFAAQRNDFSVALGAARAAQRDLIDLSAANPVDAGLGWDNQQLGALLSSPALAGYAPEPFGMASAREAVSRELAAQGFAVPAGQIMLSASTSEAYGTLFKLLCDPGESVLVPEPGYPLLDVLSSLENVQRVPYRLTYDGAWHVDLASLRAARESAPHARAIVVVHPNNPTGSYLQRDELAALAAHGLPIVSDEVFAEYPLHAAHDRAASALEAAETTLVFRMAGLSKSLGLPQLKLAHTAIAGPRDLVSEACLRLEHIADAYLSVASPVQLALPALLAEGAPFRARLMARVQRNRATLRQVLAGSSADVLHAEGGWYAIVRVPGTQSDEAWCLSLLEQDVVVQPGYFFGLEHGTHLVLACLAEPGRFASAAHRLRTLLDR